MVCKNYTIRLDSKYTLGIVSYIKHRFIKNVYILGYDPKKAPRIDKKQNLTLVLFGADLTANMFNI